MALRHRAIPTVDATDMTLAELEQQRQQEPMVVALTLAALSLPATSLLKTRSYRINAEANYETDLPYPGE